jgi:hypothetical protein
VQFEIVHEFDIPRDAIELAVLAPRLIDELAPRLRHMETVSQQEHGLEDGILRRRWLFAANVKVPDFAKAHVSKEMLIWEERMTYALKRHEATWDIFPKVKPGWQKYFHAHGTYSLVQRGDGSARIVRGELELLVPVAVVRAVAERLIVNEVKKTFDAEAATLRDVATLV